MDRSLKGGGPSMSKLNERGGSPGARGSSANPRDPLPPYLHNKHVQSPYLRRCQWIHRDGDVVQTRAPRGLPTKPPAPAAQRSTSFGMGQPIRHDDQCCCGIGATEDPTDRTSEKSPILPDQVPPISGSWGLAVTPHTTEDLVHKE